MYRNILCAVDLSEVSSLTIKKAAAIAKLHGAELQVCTVTDSDVFLQTPYGYAVVFDYETDFIKPRMQEFSKFCETFEIPEDKRHFLKGAAKEEILNLAETLKSDCVILGAHAHSRLGMLGSVASVVANKAACDVLIVRINKV